MKPITPLNVLSQHEGSNRIKIVLNCIAETISRGPVISSLEKLQA